jgi:ABC-type glycerol-3-phosphate transport system substrate-binding protein
VATAAAAKLTWLEWWSKEWGQKNMHWLLDGFAATYPNLSVDMTDVAYTEMQPKLQTAAVAGQGWDVYGTERGPWIINWEKYGFAEDLTPWLEKAGADLQRTA